jgi:hypothetical protein
MAWFFWDVSFYGNKLFQSTFIKIISGGKNATIMTNLLWTLLNSGVALIGYYFAGERRTRHSPAFYVDVEFSFAGCFKVLLRIFTITIMADQT